MISVRICYFYFMPHEYTASYLKDAVSLFIYYKKLGEGAMAQLSDDQLAFTLDDEANSIAMIIKHMAGNMRSRWTDFLTTDGEKPGRNRDSEFEQAPDTRLEIMRLWNSGWACLFSALESLSDSDLVLRVTIRGEAHSVMQAVNRQLAHYSYHIGQIVLIAKHLSQGEWRSLSIPRAGSAGFNRKIAAGEASQR